MIKDTKTKFTHFKNDMFKGQICNTFPVLNHEINMICDQKLTKHAKLKIGFSDNNATASIFSFLNFHYRSARLFVFWPVRFHPLPISPVPLYHSGLPDKNERMHTNWTNRQCLILPDQKSLVIPLKSFMTIEVVKCE